ncbi:RagB/SusD family nutrient uptake outer membrane protein [Flagellimonas pacifica]|uniref:Starch-binding associating with outer membrane n=1 Tax=Flagellimonas pacifica TaxID=1247520 RepID=A0A285MG02_9FLAO|nr:RagB/SusD family nutrient uptake outer membrane protein [Allomuricauda parva]SNY95407.1 Starch-binding associating with outer membrane [Allomuricauda parva]
MKIRLLKGLMTILLILNTMACSDYVDVVPENIAVIEDAFETRDSAERFLATLYGYLPAYENANANPALSSGDEIFVNTNVSRNWPSAILAQGGQTVSSPLMGYWGTGSVSNLFIALRDCNIFLENVDKPFNLTEDEKIRWIAEAKFLKAYYHFYLMRMYGPIPLVRENIEVSEGVDAVRVPRNSVEEVTDYIVELLDEAIADLPASIADEGAELGRITAPIAAAIKARVLVTAASPLFNGNADYSSFLDSDGNELISTTYSEDKWVRAAEACQQAIQLAEANGHSLYQFDDPLPTWADITITKLSIRGSITERWNPEIIWGASGETVATLQNWAQAKIATGLTGENRESVQSWWSPPLQIAEMFYSENGVPIDEDTSYDFAGRYDVITATADDLYNISTGHETAKLHFNREPRFYASIGFDGGTWMGHGREDDTNLLFPQALADQKSGKLDAQRFAASGYWAKKLVYYENVQRTGGATGYSLRAYPFPVVRLADLYLLYAEALNESGNTSEAHSWIDRVRNRAGLDGVVDSWAAASNNPAKPTTKDGLRDIVHDERMIELVFEGQRFWDIRRWKRAPEFLNTDILGWNIDGETPGAFYNVISVGTYKFQSRDYLWPIPERDIITNDRLIQNPGW